MTRECPICDKVFFNGWYLLKHGVIEHGFDDAPPEVLEKARQYPEDDV